MENNTHKGQKIIFFDGVCVLCNSFVDEVMSRDKSNTFLLSPLQGETASKLLTTEQRKLDNNGDPTSIIYWADGEVYFKSAAVFKVLGDLGGAFNFFKFFNFLPLVFKDSIYNIVAKYRYKIFGKKESCRLPTPEERKRFLP